MIISVTCMALGGYILINSNLHTLLENEAKVAYDYSDMVYYSLENELSSQTLLTQLDIAENQDENEDAAVILNHVASSIDINNMNKNVSFGIVSSDGKEIYSSLVVTLDKKILSSLDQEKKGWAVKKNKDGTYIQALLPIQYQDSTFYIETLRDVSSVFDGQKQQYETLLEIMVGMIVVAGLFTFIISKLLVRRVVLLSEITKDLTDGNLSKRVSVSGRDEITTLSRNFNKMADELEEKICALQDEAHKKELFVGAFSHELKTPLTSIIGYSDMIRSKDMSKEQLYICSDYIFSEGKRLENLSMRLMDLIILQNQDVHFVTVNIKQLFEEVCILFTPIYKELNIKLSCELEMATILMEPDLMKTVLINLIDNGRKAIEKNGQITISGKWYQDDYKVSIRDTGKGMEKQELDKITEAFYMVDKSRSRKQGGVGLGLAICDEILKLHHFELCFESKLNMGTTAIITMKGVKND